MMQFFDWYQLAAVICLACLGMGRAAALSRRGVQVIVVERQRSPVVVLSDTLILVVLVCFFLQTIALAIPQIDRFIPFWMKAQLFDNIVAKVLGAVMLVEALVVYGLAVRAMGDSWRLGIDSGSPGPLVTDGIFAFSRNPIYVALEEFFIAMFLIQGRLVPLVLTAIFFLLIHAQIVREERFLDQQFGDAYRDYRSQVGRYFSWPGRSSQEQ